MPVRALLVALLVLLLVSVPFLGAVYAAGPQAVFGGFLFNPLDGNTYLAKMHQGWRGEWLFHLAYTAEPSGKAAIFTFYLFLGHLARWLGFPLGLTFHLARLAGAALLLWVLWRFVTLCRPGGRWPVAVYALAALGLGLGWLLFPFQIATVDFWVAEAFPFLAAYATPHFSLSLALLLWLFSAPLDRPGEGGFWRMALIFLASLWLAGMSPFSILVALLVLGGWLAWEIGNAWAGQVRHSGQSAAHSLLAALRPATPRQVQLWRSLLLIGLGGMPYVLYQTWAIRSDPLLLQWNAQNLTWTPAVWDLLLAFSPALWLAVPGAWSLRGDRRSPGWLALIWVVMGFALAYFPFDLQRRFLIGLAAPLAVLAGYGLDKLAVRREKLAGRLALLLPLLTLPTLLLLLVIGWFGVQSRSPLFLISADEAGALAWIDAHTTADALVLAAPETGMFIPAHTGRRVLYGHPMETVNAEAEQAALEGFFQQRMAAPAGYLQQRGVDYILYGPREQALGLLPDGLPLEAVFHSGDVTLYRVTP